MIEGFECKFGKSKYRKYYLVYKKKKEIFIFFIIFLLNHKHLGEAQLARIVKNEVLCTKRYDVQTPPTYPCMQKGDT